MTTRLIEQLETHFRQMAPHVAERKSGLLIELAIGRIKLLEEALRVEMEYCKDQSIAWGNGTYGQGEYAVRYRKKADILELILQG